MERRKFIKNTALASASAVAATSALSSPAISQGKKQWIAVSAFGKASLLGQALDSFSAAVDVMSGGRLTIQNYHAGELVAPFEAMDAVQSGTAQMGYGAPYYWPGILNFKPLRSATVFTSSRYQPPIWFPVLPIGKNLSPRGL